MTKLLKMLEMRSRAAGNEHSKGKGCSGRREEPMLTCIRCGRSEDIEIHHIVETLRGGNDEPENKEPRCKACHKFEHVRRSVEAALLYEKQRGQGDRIKCYQHRLEVLEALNTPELIRNRGTYLSYWTDTTTRYLPRRIPTIDELKVDRLIQQALSEEFGV